MSKRKRLLFIVAMLASFALVAASCGDGDDDDETTDTTAETDASETSAAEEDSAAETTDTSAEEADEGDDAAAAGDGPVRIAVVAPSAQNDLAFTQSMVDALGVVEGTREIEVDITDGTFVVEDAAAAMRGYAEDGFDLIIAHGSQYGAPLQEIAADFPETSFAWGTTTDTFGLDNVFAYTTAADQGGFVNGTMAAALSESGVIGVVGPIEVGDAKLYVDGFQAGALAQNPDLDVQVNYIESFSDVALAAEQAQIYVDAGADVMTGTAQMVVGATGVARDEGIAWFGTQANQTSLGEENVVASQVYHWEVVLEPILDSIASGTLGGEIFELTLENGGLVIEFNDGYELSDEIRTLGEDTATGIADGSIETGVS